MSTGGADDRGIFRSIVLPGVLFSDGMGVRVKYGRNSSCLIECNTRGDTVVVVVVRNRGVVGGGSVLSRLGASVVRSSGDLQKDTA